MKLKVITTEDAYQEAVKRMMELFYIDEPGLLRD
jgi:hypothetical protein